MLDVGDWHVGARRDGRLAIATEWRQLSQRRGPGERTRTEPYVLPHHWLAHPRRRAGRHVLQGVVPPPPPGEEEGKFREGKPASLSQGPETDESFLNKLV